MAETEWTIKSQGYSGTTILAKVQELGPFIASNLGLSLIEEKLENEGTAIYLYYEYPSIPGVGLSVYCENTKAATPYIYIGGIYKNASGVWTSNGLYWVGKINAKYETGAMVVRSKNIGPFKVYHIPGVNNGVYQGGGYFIPFTAVDYFTNKTRKGVYVSNLTSFWLYDSTTNVLEEIKLLCSANDYPSGRLLTVAMPVVAKTDSFYGFLDGSTTVYHINNSSEHTIGQQIEVAGHTFEKLVGSYWVRLS